MPYAVSLLVPAPQTVAVLLLAAADALVARTAGRWLQARADARTGRRYVMGGIYIGLGVAAACGGAKTK